MSELEFRDQLPVATRRTKYSAVAEALRDNLGSWALIVTTGSGTATRFRKGTPAFPKGEFEFATRSTDDPTKVDIWARYVGEA